MESQDKFLEMLQEIKGIAASQQNRLTKEEIRKYLGEDTLSEDKMEAVYHYLGENHIVVEGYDFVPDIPVPKKPAETKPIKKNTAQGKKPASAKSTTARESRREANMRLYRQEVARLTEGTQQLERAVLGFLQGNDLARETIIENYLHKVVELAGNYQKRNVPMDEVISEGNVGLMLAMQIVGDNREEYLLPDGSLHTEKFYGTLNMEITHAMESYIDEMTASRDWEHAMLAKTNLLHEATKYMAEEMGRIPTIEELSEYTKIPREEIKDIMGLSEDAKRVAVPE